MKNKIILLLLIYLFLNNIIYSLKLEIIKDDFEECTIYQADEDTKINFYIYVPYDNNKKPYMKLTTKLITISGFIEYKNVILLNDKKNKYTIDTSKIEHIFESTSGSVHKSQSSGTYIETSGWCIEKATLILSEEQIDEIIKYFMDVKEVQIRFVGDLSHNDDELTRREIKFIIMLLKKWKELTSQ